MKLITLGLGAGSTIGDFVLFGLTQPPAIPPSSYYLYEAIGYSFSYSAAGSNFQYNVEALNYIIDAIGYAYNFDGN